MSEVSHTAATLDEQITESVRYTICYYTGCISGLGTAAPPGSDIDVVHDVSGRVMLLVQNSEAAISKYCCIAQDVLAVNAWVEWFNERHASKCSSSGDTKPAWFYYFYTMGFMNGAALAAKISAMIDGKHEFVGSPMLAETQDRAMKHIFELQFS